jgi:hypothetical protein
MEGMKKERMSNGYGYDYEVVQPPVDKRKLVELAHMIAGKSVPTIRKPTLYLRKVNTNIQNIYGNNVAAWKTGAV